MPREEDNTAEAISPDAPQEPITEEPPVSVEGEAPATPAALPSSYTFKYVCIGGGVAAGYWAHAMVENLDCQGVAIEDRSIAIITTYPKGILPYERPALTKAALDPTNPDIRKWTCEAFPFTR